MSNLKKGQKYSQSERKNFFNYYIANKEKGLRAIAKELNFEYINFYLMTRSRWWNDMLNDYYSDNPDENETILEELCENIAVLRSDGTRPTIDEVRAFVYQHE